MCSNAGNPSVGLLAPSDFFCTKCYHESQPPTFAGFTVAKCQAKISAPGRMAGMSQSHVTSSTFEDLSSCVTSGDSIPIFKRDGENGTKILLRHISLNKISCWIVFDGHNNFIHKDPGLSSGLLSESLSTFTIQLYNCKTCRLLTGKMTQIQQI